ncbi:tautomerase family protein [Deinococcus sonorensis]|uniref:Tautomerase family protein n=2 Tax=Deinococcus sonorensis TaxID=309891 RepID=A0AAU7UAP1_9DEIO
MAQIKVYALRSTLDALRPALSDMIQAALGSALGLPESKRFQRFLPLAPEDFVFPEDRSERYTIMEVQLFTGRRPETLRQLIRDLQRGWQQDLGGLPNDLEVVLIQTPAEQWGIRGQLGHELSLSYEVNV